MTASRLLRGIGAHAAITEDGFTPGAFVLSIGGAEQSHVDLARPEESSTNTCGGWATCWIWPQSPDSRCGHCIWARGH
ncbi:hypothetical protein [Arthrobacter zhangbolii]|uniref:hypothetical protein n=1 Tax=Arthrobacter zhangbolii TaxID=2886936 RepID=UPI00311AA168